MTRTQLKALDRDDALHRDYELERLAEDERHTRRRRPIIRPAPEDIEEYLSRADAFDGNW